MGVGSEIFLLSAFIQCVVQKCLCIYFYVFMDAPVCLASHLSAYAKYSSRSEFCCCAFLPDFIPDALLPKSRVGTVIISRKRRRRRQPIVGSQGRISVLVHGRGACIFVPCTSGEGAAMNGTFIGTCVCRIFSQHCHVKPCLFRRI